MFQSEKRREPSERKTTNHQCRLCNLTQSDGLYNKPQSIILLIGKIPSLRHALASEQILQDRARLEQPGTIATDMTNYQHDEKTSAR